MLMEDISYKKCVVIFLIAKRPGPSIVTFEELFTGAATVGPTNREAML